MARNKNIAVIGIKGAWSTETLADAVQAQTGNRTLIGAEDIVADLSTGEVRLAGQNARSFDGIIVKKIAAKYSPHALDRLALLELVEAQGVRVFSPARSMRPLINRLDGSIGLYRVDAPLPSTLVTESIDAGLAMIEKHGAVICKPLYTSKARGMEFIDAGPSAETKLRAFQEAGNPMMYIQALVQAPGRDLGVSFLGGQYIGTYARVKAKDSANWRTTTTSGGHYEGHEPSAEIIELARRAQAPFGLDFTCVDVVETSDGPKIYEVSAFGGFRGLLEGCGFDAANAYVEYALKELDNAQ